MEIHLASWLVLFAVVIAVLIFDFYGHVRHNHYPSLREAGTWSLFYITLALLVGVFIGSIYGWRHGGEYYAGWITEWSLSLDNLFVFIIMMSGFRVPRELQQKVLAIGIALALLMRFVFILLGAALIEHFSWVFYIFGVFLLYTAWQQCREGKMPATTSQEPYEDNAFIRNLRRFLPVTDDYVGDRFVHQSNGRYFITPLFLVIIALACADLMFAVDSIPAIYGLTEEPFIVFTANAFALLGLRQLYFLIEGLMHHLVYLHYGLAAILAFIGGKLILHALHSNELPFINNGQAIDILPEPSIPISLAFIVLSLIITALLSWQASHHKQD